MNDTINRVIVPGTFDPITFGHIDVIRRARRIFPSVIVAVAESQGKNGVGTTFMLDERVALAREALGDIDGVEVLPFTGLLVDFAREQGAGAVVKGLRAMTDFEYELQQADLNYRLDSELESIFVMSAPQYGYISSSVVPDRLARQRCIDICPVQRGRSAQTSLFVTFLIAWWHVVN